MHYDDEIQLTLEDLRVNKLFRNPVQLESPAGPYVTVGGEHVVCLCSNDYLALAASPEQKEAVIESIERWGVGSGASRLISGTMAPHRDLECAIAEFKRTEDAVVTSTGWMANRLAICSLIKSGDLVVCDKLCHASIVDAALGCGGRFCTYLHSDIDSLRNVLKKRRGDYKRCLIVTDSLFSMDGDLAPLSELVEIKQKYDAALMIDEAHATGVFGHGGRGVAEYLEVEQYIDVTVGTLSKALGCIGGFVATSRKACDLFRNAGRSYIYTTALPPAICIAAKRAIATVCQDSQGRQHLLQMAKGLRDNLGKLGFETLNSASQIIPVVTGQAERAMEISEKLLEEGFLIPAIRPPTVPKNTSRLRISLSVGHKPADIERLPSVLARIAGMR